MQKTVLLYGATLAALTGILKFVEYRFFIRELSLEVYLGVVAVLCAGVGAWAGMRLTRRKIVVAQPDLKLDESELRKLGISKREYEVLELMAQGLSNPARSLITSWWVTPR